jgi:hypothetical protein
MKIVKSILLVVAILLSLMLILIGSWATWEHHRDPIRAIDKHPGKVALALDSLLASNLPSPSRTYRQIILNTEHIGDIEALISRPVVIPNQGLPVVIILGGLEIGIQNFQLIPDPGNNIIIIYRYPYSPRYWYDGAAVNQIPIIRRSVLSVPSQVVTLKKWVDQQTWAEEERTSIIGYSFGALFIPAVYHLATCKKVNLQPGVIAYAGADIFDLLKTNLKNLSQPFRTMVAWIASTAIYPVEPALHLPYMNNEFLIINGTKDHQVSEYSWRKLHRLVPEPKKIIILDEGHMHPNKPELTMKLVQISQKWLLEKGVINP